MPKARYPKHPFDLEHGTDTGGLTPGPELKTGHAHDKHNTAYYGIAPSLFRRLIAQWKQTKPPHALGKYSFIDFGAGKGRAMLLASEFNFKQVIGVELHPELVKKCRRNLRIWDKKNKQSQALQNIKPIHLIEGDATEFIYPEGPCLVYLFNPFGAPVLRRVLKAIEKRKGDVDILYVNHERQSVIKSRSSFKQLWRGNIPMSSLDAIVDLQIINSQLDGEYGSTGDEACSIYRLKGK